MLSKKTHRKSDVLLVGSVGLEPDSLFDRALRTTAKFPRS